MSDYDNPPIHAVHRFFGVEFSIVMWSVNDCVVSFCVMPLVTTAPEVLYRERSGDDFTTDWRKAERLLVGDIKFDGCSNVQQPEPEQDTMFHFCGRHSAMILGRAMDCAYKMANEEFDLFRNLPDGWR